MGRICVVGVLDERIGQHEEDITRRIGAKVLRSDTELEFKGLTPGLMRGYDFMNSYFYFLNNRQIVEKVLEAEKEGYDAVVVHCFMDPAVHEARVAVDIPVIGPGESSLLFACMLGHKLAVISPNDPALVIKYEQELKNYGLLERAIPNPIRPFTTMSGRDFARINNLEEAMTTVPGVLEKARECVADGADVVVIGCTMLGPMCTLSGITKLDDPEVPIIDCLAVALKTAEAVIDLRARLGLPAVSRATIYAKAREKDFHRVRANFGLT